MGQPEQQLLTATGKIWRFGLGRKICSFVVATIHFFFNQQKRS
jgi:hypothetical protein